MSVHYFMDECTDWEINDIIENIPYLDRNLWESQRMNAYITAQINSKKKLKFQDICTFKWETENDIDKNPNDIEISNEEINRLKELSKKWQD